MIDFCVLLVRAFLSQELGSRRVTLDRIEPGLCCGMRVPQSNTALRQNYEYN